MRRRNLLAQWMARAARAGMSLAVLAAAAPVWAQPIGKAKPTAATGWVSVVVALVLAVGVGVASFVGSKRGHRD